MRTPPARSLALILCPLSAAVLAASTGCQTAAPTVRASDAAQLAAAAAATGEPIVIRTVGGPLDETEAPADPLTLAAAVRQALRSSPEVQVALSRVRAAEADVDQAGLLPNPILNVVFRLPAGGGKPQVEASLAEDLVAVLLRPQRASVADRRLRAAGGDAVTAALNVVADVQARYAAVQALDALVPVLEERRRLLARVLELARARLEGGEGTQLDLTVAQAQQSDLEVEVAERMLERRQERLALTRLIGQPSGAAAWRLCPWEPPRRAAAPESAWVRAGLSRRTELRLREHELAARETEARLTRLEVFGPGGVGVDAQCDPGWAAGPAVSLPVPLFDVGQARRAKAEAAVVEARHELTRSRREIVEAIRKAYEASVASADTLRRVREELVPLQQKRRDQAEAAYRAGQTDITAVILADQDFQAARARLIDLESRTSRAFIDLERAAGGPAVAAELAAEHPPPPSTRPASTAPAPSETSSDPTAGRPAAPSARTRSRLPRPSERPGFGSLPPSQTPHMHLQTNSPAKRPPGAVGHPCWRLAVAVSLGLSAASAGGCDKGDAAGAGDKPAKAAEAGERKNEAGGDAHDHAHGEHADEVKLTADAVRANRITVATAGKQVLVSTLTAPARLGFNTEQVAHVGSILKGRVAELTVRLGDTVRKGDPLAVVDSTELGEAQSEYLQRRVAADIADPALDLAKGAYDRARTLYDKSQGISFTELQKRLGEYQTARGAVGAAAAALTASENRLRLLAMTPEAIRSLATAKQLSPRYTILAPIDGQVVAREATIGELVSPEKEHLLTLADMRTLWVFADVPEARLFEVAVGAKAKVTVAASRGEAVEGTVSHILPQLDATTRTARLRIEVRNEALALRPGMFATAQITTGTADGVVAIPDAAVQTVEGEPAVFVPHETEANTFVKRRVGVGPAVNGLVPVLAGLKEGERYVASGSFVLKAEIGKEGAAHEH